MAAWTVSFTATLALAAALITFASHPVSAQSSAPQSPAAKPVPKPKPHEPPAQNTATPNNAAAPAGAVEPNAAFAAFQRGDFLTAFSLATKRVNENNDVSAMTLLGELYANGLGVPQDDAKAAEWYKLAADRGDRQALFALAMFRLNGRAGPRDRDASVKLLAAAAKLGSANAA
jgi:TPR repeat protein